MQELFHASEVLEQQQKRTLIQALNASHAIRIMLINHLPH